MTYRVQVSGRRTPMSFSRFGTADAYRRAIVTGTGWAAWIEVT